MLDTIRAILERDPAAKPWEVVLYPCLYALLLHRAAHLLYRLHVPFLPRLISEIGRFLTGIEIHPGATIGRGLFIDHGSGVVIGETAEIGDRCTIFQGVTLGGTGKEHGKRHPTLGDEVMVGVGAKVLGGIVIGSHTYIGANAVVLRSVPPHSTVVGIPGRVVKVREDDLVGTLDHRHLPDPIFERVARLQTQVHRLERLVRGRRVQGRKRSGR